MFCGGLPAGMIRSRENGRHNGIHTIQRCMEDALEQRKKALKRNHHQPSSAIQHHRITPVQKKKKKSQEIVALTLKNSET
jgi:uncharacterized protein YjaZ